VIVRSARVVLPDGERPAAVHIDGGRIVRVDDDSPAGIDFGNLIIAPGVVDTHVHVNEPGRTEWEGFDTATRAAAAGGVTTIVDMPLNSIPATTTVAALEAKRAAARGRIHVDVAFWGGVVPGNADQLAPLVDAGVAGFKCFLVPSGVDEFPHVSESDLRAAMPILARHHRPLLVHAEDPRELRDPRNPRDPSSYAAYLETRPPRAEVSAIEMMVRLASEFGTRVHVVHVASADAVDAIARAKAGGAPVTAETCPHYLRFAAGEIPDGATEFKCAPPIRAASHRDALWAGLASGVLDLIASDHSPAPPSMKPRGDFTQSWGGIASLELSLRASWTAGGDWLRRRHTNAPQSPVANRFAMLRADITRWLSAAPARLANLDGRKGRIAPGYDADLVLWDPDAETVVAATQLQQRHHLTPYASRPLRGTIKATFLRGERVWDDGALVRAGHGQLL
jgi:allantoinase